ncbi:MAG: MFS transporter, partial [Lachnospiraceae bacterium]|nr:MFS transporter [Lachnospiraceae bacterium]
CWLGFALLFMAMGGIVGSKLILQFPKLKYRSVYVITLLLVLTGVLAEHSSMWAVMTLGGFLAAVGDDAMQVRTNALLQDMFPSEQRATLTSVESFSFSVIMIVLSPLAGIVFTYW